MQDKQKSLRLCSMVFILVMALIFGGMFCKIEADAADATMDVLLSGTSEGTYWTGTTVSLSASSKIYNVSNDIETFLSDRKWFLNGVEVNSVGLSSQYSKTFDSAGTYVIKCWTQYDIDEGSYYISNSTSRTYKIVSAPTISANYTSYNLKCGETLQISTNCSQDLGRTWTVSDSSDVLTYSTQNGSGSNTKKYITITGSTDTSKIGKTAKLTVKVSRTLGGETKSASASINIKLVKEPVTSITLTSERDYIWQGEYLELDATVNPSNASFPDVTWTSSDTSIATVSNSSGSPVKVMGVKPGNVTITATADGVSATKDFTVKSLAISCDKTWLWTKQTLNLQAIVSPDNTTTSVTWKTSNSSIAKLSSTTGSSVTLTGVARGVATITIDNGICTATKQITVKQPVTSIAIAGLYRVWVGGTSTLTATCSPSNANDKTVSWKSSDTTYATVSSSGVVTGIKADSDGATTVTITATANDGYGTYKNISFTVYQQVEEIELSADKSYIYVGETLQISAAISPSNAYNKTLEWTSSDNSIATVDDKGRVTGVKAADKVTITATATDGYKDASGNPIKKSISFRVYNHATDVSISNNEIELFANGSEFTSALSATALPTPIIDLRDSQLIWTSQNTNLVTIKEGQNVKLNSNATISLIPNASGRLGTTTITATSVENSDAKATCSVELIGLKLNSEKLEAFVSGEFELIALKTTAFDSIGSEYDDVSWEITKGKDIIEFVDDKYGTASFSALKAGVAEVTVTATASNTVSAKCTITVKNFDVKASVSSIYAPRNGASNPESTVLSAIYDGKPLSVNWEIIEGKEYASLSETTNSETTVLTAISTDGATTRSVKVKATSISADSNGPMTIEITIKQPIDEISFTKNEINMFTGTSYTFTNAEMTPTNSHNIKWNWVIDGSNVSLINADSNGHSVTITANDNAVNGARLIASASDGRGATASATLNVRKLLLNSQNISLYLGNKVTLQAFYTLSALGAKQPQTVKWEIESGADLISLSNNSGSSTIISANTQNKTGTAIIKATATEDTTASITCTVIVTAFDILTDKDFIYVKSDNTSADKYQTQATAKIGTETVSVEWSSLDTNIATIDSKTGLITGVGTKGQKSATARIKATMDDGSSAIKYIEVRQQATRVDICVNNKPTTELIVYKGTTVDISGNINPSYVYDPSLSWKVSNSNITLSNTISNAGEVISITGNKAGTATVQVMATDGVSSNVGSECVVSVKELSLSHTTLSVYAGGTVKLNAYSTITDCVDQDVKWTIENGEIASLETTVGNEVVIRGLKQGETIVTATTTDGVQNVSASCVVHVKTIEIKADKTVIYVKNSNTDLNDYTATLSASVDGKPVSCYWSISNTKAASINKSANVLAEKVKVTGLDSKTEQTTVVVTAVYDNDGDELNHGTASITLTIIQQPYKIEVSETSLILYKGTNYNVSANIYPEYTHNKNVVWSLISGSDVVSISPSGSKVTINALEVGNASIKVTAEDDKGVEPAEINVVVKDMTLSDEKITLFVDKTHTLSAMINGIKSSVNWAVEDSNIAKISTTKGSSVTITGVSKGETMIHATSFDGHTNVLKSAKVIVKSIVVEAPVTTMYVGEKLSLTAKIDGVESSVYWYSSDESIATVNKNLSSVGLVTGVSKGEVIIYATLNGVINQNNAVATKIEVLQQVESLKITGKTNITMYAGATYPVSISLTPANASTTDFSWTTSNRYIASFQSTNDVYTQNLNAVSAGTATFEIMANDINSASVSGTVIVKELIIPKEISIYTGSTYSLTAMTSDNEETSVNWSISGDCATINKTTGSTITITGKKNGEAIISATTTDADANATVTCRIKVVDIDLTAEKDVIYIGETSVLTAKINGNKTNCTWSSSDKSIATVSSKGIVTGVSVGKVTITAKVNGYNDATIEIEVKKAVSSITLNKDKIVIYGNGHYTDLIATILPADASDLTVTANSNLTYVLANTDGNKTYFTLKPQSIGKETITVFANDGQGASDTCDVYVKSLHLSNDSMTLFVGEVKTLTAWSECVTKENIVGKWEIDNADIAKLTVKNNTAVDIKALAPGEATITVTTTNGDVNTSASCKITVIQPVETITLNVSQLTLKQNRSYNLTVDSILPETASDKSVTWTMSNDNIVVLVAKDNTATIIAKNVGTTTITATANDGCGAVATCVVTVTENNPSELVMYKGTSKKMTIDPFSGASVKSTTWTSSDSTIVKIKSPKATYATFSALKSGTVTITATSISKTGLEAVTEFTVHVKDLTVPSKLTMYKGTSYTLVLDTDVVSWATSDSSIASINTSLSNAVVITANKAGKATITATTVNADVNVTKKCVVTVKEFSISAEHHTMAIGETWTLSAFADDTALSVKWAINNKNVSKNLTTGSVVTLTAKKVGTSIVTATTRNGAVKVSKTCTITVVQPITKLVMNNQLTVYVGEETDLNVTYVPSNASNIAVDWSGYDDSIISVNGRSTNGVTYATIKGLKCGETLLTATAKDGYGATASCQVTVKQRVSKIELPTEHIMYVGSSTTLTHTVLPNNATDKTVIWTSSKPDIATINSNTGLIKAMKAGTTTIACSATDGSGIVATCRLIVKQFVEQIILKNPTIDIYTNYEDNVHTAKIEIFQILPETITDVELYWESSNPEYITVDQYGVITVQVSSLPNNLSYVNVPITCYATDGSGVFATCIVILKQHASEIILIDYEQFFTIEDGIIIGLTSYANDILANSNIAISIPEIINKQKVIGMANDVFKDCLTLTQVVIPASMETIGESAFKGCNNLTDIYVLKNTNEIKNAPWGATNAEIHWLDVDIDVSKAQDFIITAENRHIIGWTADSTILNIPDYFYEKSGIYYKVVGIDANAFEKCTKLKSVFIPGTVTSIGDYAFDGCSNLTSVTLSEGIVSLGEWTFRSCKALTSITFPASATSIKTNVLYQNPKLMEINVVEGNPNYKSVDGVMFNKSGTELFKYPAARTGEYTIPDSVTTIGVRAFQCSSLTKVNLPDKLTTIREHAFQLSALVNVVIPDTVKTIGGRAYCNCSYLTSIVLPNGLTNISDYLLSSCSKLTEITIPASVKTIGSNAFSSCKTLTDIWVNANKDTIPNAPWGATNATVHWLDEDTSYSVSNQN